MSNQQSEGSRLNIAVLIGEVNSYTDLIWSGITEVAVKNEINLIALGGKQLVGELESKNSHNIIYQLANGKQINGVIILTSEIGQSVSPQKLKDFCKQFLPLPVVSIGEEIEGISSVTVDNSKGYYDLICHLIDIHGRQRLAFVQGPENSIEAQLRFQTYQRVLTEKQIPYDANLIAPGGFHYKYGRTAIENLLERGVDFDAVVGINDASTWGVLDTLRKHGIYVPYDVAVIGFDDYIESHYTIPPLSTVRQPRYKLGSQAVEIILGQLARNEALQNRVLLTEMVVRQSCGCKAPSIQQDKEAKTKVEEIIPTITNNDDLLSLKAIIIEDMIQNLKQDPPSNFSWIQKNSTSLLEAFFEVAVYGNSGEFIKIFDRTLQQSVENGENLDGYHTVLSILRHHILRNISAGSEIAEQLEVAWQQARITLSNVIQYAEYHQRYQTHLRTLMLFEINADVIATFDLPKLMNSLVKAFEQLELPYYFLCLNDDPDRTHGLDKLPKWSRLILAYVDGEQRQLEPGGVRFLTKEILPEASLPNRQRYDFYIMPLRFQDNYLGHAIFELDNRPAFIYDALQIQISSAIQGASLIDQLSEAQSELEHRVEERTAELQKEIIERSRVEETLRENKQRYQALFEQTTDAVFLFDFNTRHIMVNQKAADILGYTVEELLEMSGEKFLTPDEKRDAQNKLEMALQGKPVPLYERNLIHRDGHLIPVEINLLLVTDIDGKPLHFQSIVRDITQRKRRECLTDALNQASLAMRNSLTSENIFEAVGNGLKMMGFECTIFRTNHDRSKISPEYYSYDSKVVANVEKMINVKLREIAIPIENIEIFQKTIWDQEPLIILDPDEAISQLLPETAKGLSKQIVRLLDIGRSIYAPLIVSKQTLGMFTIQAKDLLEEDIPMVMAFADQIAANWQKARLMQELELSLNEQLLVEEFLRRSEQKFRTLFELSPEAIILVGLNGIILDVNQAVEQIFERKKKEIIGQPFLDLGFWNEDQEFLPGYNELFSRAIGSDRPGPIELQLNIQEAETLWIEVHPALLKEGTDILALQLIIQDITDRRKAEQALLKSEEQFRSIFENAVMGIYRSTPDGQIIMANPAMIQMLGYSSFDELVQQDLNVIKNTGDIPRDEFDSQIERDGQVIGFETTWTRKDGSILFGQENAKALYDSNGQIIFYEGTVEDITQRKLIEQERQALIEFQRIVAMLSARFINLSIYEIEEEIGQALQIIAEYAQADACSVWLFSKDKLSASKTHGWPSNDQDSGNQKVPISRYPWLIGKILDNQSVIISSKNDVRANADDMLELLSTMMSAILAIPLVSEGDVIGSLIIYMLEGEKKWADDLEALSKIIGDIIINALERKRAEESIHQLNEDLELRVIQRTRQLVAANKDLELFAYSVSHDLRAPLRAIDGFSLALIEDYGNDLDDTAKNFLHRLRTASQRMGQIIDDLLKLSRVTRSEMVHHPGKFKRSC